MCRENDKTVVVHIDERHHDKAAVGILYAFFYAVAVESARSFKTVMTVGNEKLFVGEKSSECINIAFVGYLPQTVCDSLAVRETDERRVAFLFVGD